MVPGHPEDQSAYRSELCGILGMLLYTYMYLNLAHVRLGVSLDTMPLRRLLREPESPRRVCAACIDFRIDPWRVRSASCE